MTPKIAMHASLQSSLLALAGATLALIASGCGGDADAAPTTLRISGIPDDKNTDIAALGRVIEDYLSKELDMPVEYVVSKDYSAAVNAIAANKIDVGWYGGVTGIEAVDKCEGKAQMIATRAKDLKFKSYFIANKGSVDAGKVGPVDSLEELKPMLANCSFSFGPQGSTSGHVMPRHFMVQAGIDPEQDISGGPKYQETGGHAATRDAVLDGTVDLGVLNYTYWDRATAEQKAKAVVIYETPEYVDYCMVARDSIGDDLIAKIQTAFTQLDPANPDHKAVLDAFSADTFIKADSSRWQSIRDVVEDLQAKGMLK